MSSGPTAAEAALQHAFPILVVDADGAMAPAAGRAVEALLSALGDSGAVVLRAADPRDAALILDHEACIGALLVHPAAAEDLVRRLHARRPAAPVFLLTEDGEEPQLSGTILGEFSGLLPALEDSSELTATRILAARSAYLQTLLPPVFSAVLAAVERAPLSWRAPGHHGGSALAGTPAAAAFGAFLGEHALRADTVQLRGPVTGAGGPLADAQRRAAGVFGASRTLWFSGGVEAANRSIIAAAVGPGEVVLVDRHCDVSVLDGITVAGAVPVFLSGSVNAHGLLAPVGEQLLGAEPLARVLAAHPLVPDAQREAGLAVLAPATLDGLCARTPELLTGLAPVVDRVLFDEAWFAYAHFHPLYRDRHAMGITPGVDQPAILATQAGDRVLGALTQAAMVHLHDPARRVDPGALEAAAALHGVGAPSPAILASLDVSAAMLAPPTGRGLLDAALEEAVHLRRELGALGRRSGASGMGLSAFGPEIDEGVGPDAWSEPGFWSLGEGRSWSGFRADAARGLLLDPLKVTLLTPGLDAWGHFADRGVPAALLARFLREHDIEVERVGPYSLLLLVSLGTTRGHTGTLVMELEAFRRQFAADAPLAQVLPGLVREHPRRYRSLSLRDLALELHRALRAAVVPDLVAGLLSEIPEPAMTPAEAFAGLVAGRTEGLGIGRLAGRVSAVRIACEPADISVILPGERFGALDSAQIRFLAAVASLDARFPGLMTGEGIDVHAGELSVRCLCEP